MGLQLRKAEATLKSANDLLKNSDDADAVSRAYCAMLHTAQALLRSRGLWSKTHRGTQSLLKEHFVGTSALTLDDLQLYNTAMRMREEADYEVTFKAKGREVQQVVEDARRFLDRAKQILGRT